MKRKLPTFEFIIDDTLESGVKCVSIVADPAFGSAMITLEGQKKFVTFAEKKKKQICAGLSLIPNVPIYRMDEELGEYMGYFSVETIEKIVDKYHQEQLSNKVNVNHNSDAYIDAYLVEDYIVNSQSRVEDLKAMGIEHPNIIGAWYTAFKIKDPQIFANIEESGNATGFSVEAFLDRVMVNMREEVKNNIINKQIQIEMKKNNKTIKEKILQIFASENLERTLVPELALEIEWSEIGAPVNKITVNPDGSETLQPVGQGEFITDKGIVVVDEQSNLVEVRDLPEQPEVEVPVETPEAPASGDTVVSGSTEPVLAIDPITGVEAPPTEVPTGSTETVSGETAVVKSGVQKSIMEIVGTTDGTYNMTVVVQGGIVVSAEAVNTVDLMLAKQQEVDALKLQVVALEQKVKEPIGDPILAPEPKVLTPAEFQKLSAYEKLMYNRGLEAV